MAITYFATLRQLFDGPATAMQPGPWLRVREAKQVRIWAQASDATTIAFRVSIFPPSHEASGPNRDDDYIESDGIDIGTGWSEITFPLLDGPLDSICVVPLADVNRLQVYLMGSAV